MTDKFTLYIDGAASGNPGPAGIGGVIIKNGEEVKTYSQAIGEATNNIAEYQALIKGLNELVGLGALDIEVFSDSELLVKQMKGEYKVKSENLAGLKKEARQLMESFNDTSITHIPRAKNKTADGLACEAIKEKRTGGSRKKTVHSNRITFISDFGQGDGWTGICKAVIKDINPDADIIDIAHDIPVFDIRKGAFVLATAVQYVKAAAHMAVVDPGVGGQRRPVIIRTVNGSLFVGPDNGLLLPAAERDGGVDKAVSISNPAYILDEGLATFNARDVFAPVSAHITKGIGLDEFGEAIDTGTLTPGPWGDARMSSQGWEAEVIDVDRFGTARLNIQSHDAGKIGLEIDKKSGLILSSRTEDISFKRTFGDVSPGEPVMLIDSSGFLSIAINMGSAADKLGLYVGMRLHLMTS
jgi:S-adenosylmethionine hydrolase